MSGNLISARAPSAEDVSLARQLADPDKKVRDRACAGLVAFLSAATELSDLDMLKFWKCLYYCLWLSDKAPIQQELATSLANLLHACPTDAKALQFLTAFFKTILREWAHLDQYRVNKFYTLLRFVLRELFGYLQKRSWRDSLTQQILSVLQAEVFSKTPNGPRLHYADIYLSELLEVTRGELQTGQMLVLLGPLLGVLVSGTDQSLKERVFSNVFSAYVQKYAAELHDSESRAVFGKVRTGAIQHAIFSAASEESTAEGNRKRLYDAHILFQRATEVDFASEEPGDSVVTKEAGAGAGAGKAKMPKRKAEKEDDAGTDKLPAPVARTDKKSKTATVAKTSAGVEPLATSKAAAGKDTTEKKKRKLDEDAGSSSADAKLQPSKKVKNVEDKSGGEPKALAPFLASKKFAGKKAGYAFKNGKEGVGYYIDAVQQRQRQEQKRPQKDKPPTGNKVAFAKNVETFSIPSREHAHAKSKRGGKVKRS